MPEISIQEIRNEVKKLIITSLKIEDVLPEDILDNVPLLSGENTITIDSIDVIGIVMDIQKRFEVRIDDQNIARHIVNTVNTIAEFIYSEQLKKIESA